MANKEKKKPVQINERDFIEIDYTGRIADSNDVFDTTDEAVAKAQDIYNEDFKYTPAVICVGEGHILAGLDSRLAGLDIGKKYKFRLTPEQGFGKKDAKLFKLISRRTFTKEKIDPIPGLQITIDGMLGTVRSVTGGRVVVDFNHPLAGRELEYDIKILGVVSDPKEQIRALVGMVVKGDAKVYLSDHNAVVEMDVELPAEIKDTLSKKIIELVNIETVDFLKREEKKEEKEQTETGTREEKKEKKEEEKEQK